MTDWLRSLTVLLTAFVGVVVLTLGLATLIVPRPAGADRDPVASADPSASGGVGQPVEPAPSGGIPGLGGVLTVTGDREGTMRVSEESQTGAYALVGGDGRIVLEGAPPEVTQLSYEGWEFFPEPEDCSITTGNLDDAIGIGFGELVCTDLADIRGNGVVSLSGTIGLPLDRLVKRELPPTGGTVAVGEESWAFEAAYLYMWEQPNIGGVREPNMVLYDEAERYITFFYDTQTHRTTVASVIRDEEEMEVPAEACTLTREQLGRPNPRAFTVEMTISCASVEVPGLGAVPISGTIVVDELEYPF